MWFSNSRCTPAKTARGLQELGHVAEIGPHAERREGFVGVGSLDIKCAPDKIAVSSARSGKNSAQCTPAFDLRPGRGVLLAGLSQPLRVAGDY